MIKKTYQINNRELVPKFTARWQLFHKYFFTPTINNQINRTKQSYIKQQPTTPRMQRNRNRKNNNYKENKTKTHLTIIGVCTTICPENSGM
jgi:hypothetical protein